MSDVGGGRRPADPQTDFYGKPQGFSALTISCLWLFAADPPSKENPYEDIETNSRCLGKKCVLTFPASPTSSVPGTPTKVLRFKWPPLLLQRSLGPVWSRGVLPLTLILLGFFFLSVFTAGQCGMIEEDVLPCSKVKTVFPCTNCFLACIFLHTRAAFPWYFAAAVQQGATGLKGAKLFDVTPGFYAAAIQDWSDKRMGRDPLLNPFFMQMYPQQN